MARKERRIFTGMFFTYDGKTKKRDFMSFEAMQRWEQRETLADQERRLKAAAKEAAKERARQERERERRERAWAREQEKLRKQKERARAREQEKLRKQEERVADREREKLQKQWEHDNPFSPSAQGAVPGYYVGYRAKPERHRAVFVTFDGQTVVKEFDSVEAMKQWKRCMAEEDAHRLEALTRKRRDQMVSAAPETTLMEGDGGEDARVPGGTRVQPLSPFWSGPEK